jgi:hypothetical protein
MIAATLLVKRRFLQTLEYDVLPVRQYITDKRTIMFTIAMIMMDLGIYIPWASGRNIWSIFRWLTSSLWIPVLHHSICNTIRRFCESRILRRCNPEWRRVYGMLCFGNYSGLRTGVLQFPHSDHFWMRGGRLRVGWCTTHWGNHCVGYSVRHSVRCSPSHIFTMFISPGTDARGNWVLER